MTLSEMASYVCTKVGQTDTPSVEACKLFLRRRYQMIWDSALWKETMFNAAATTNTSGIVVLPSSCDQVVAVRDGNFNVAPADRATVATAYPWLQNDFTTPGYEFIFLSPSCLPNSGEHVLVPAGSAIDPTYVFLRSTSPEFTLGDSGLYTGDDAMGLHGGTSGTADTISVLYDDGSPSDVYFYSLSGAPGVGWRKQGGGATDYTNQTIAPGTRLRIRRITGQSFTWSMPENDLFGENFFVSVLSSSANDSTQRLYVTGEGYAGQLVSDIVPLTSTTAASTLNSYANVSSVTLDLPSEGRLYVTGIAVAFIEPGVLSVPACPRIQLLGVTTERPISVLCKRVYNDLTSDVDVPQLRNCQNALLAYAQADMLERQRQYNKSAVKMKEAAQQLQIMVDIERNQSANMTRIIPAPTNGTWEGGNDWDTYGFLLGN